jgi:hypothetical protein|tara:strand:+ start:821 stop:931 length:111 start_codon:yes stop_codon:yes gene_type:complete
MAKIPTKKKLKDKKRQAEKRKSLRTAKKNPATKKAR